MINSLIRGVIVYVALIAAVRLMGKRQIGQLQASELVVTILLSEVAAMPLQNSAIPIFTSLSLVFLLASLEVISSVLSTKSPSFRRLVQGNSVLVIKKGEILQDKLVLIRYSVDDLFEALRLKDVFDIRDVDYAYIETNGSISVKLKKDCMPQTKKASQDGIIPCLVVTDGKIIEHEFCNCNMTTEKLIKIIDNKGIKLKDILLMTADSRGETYIVRKKADKK